MLYKGYQKIIIHQIETTKRDISNHLETEEFSLSAAIQHEEMMNKEYTVIEDDCKIQIENEKVYLILPMKKRDKGSAMNINLTQELVPPRQR